MNTATMTAAAPRIVSRQDWLASRLDLLAREKQLKRLSDEVSRERRALPWVKLDKKYVFRGPKGTVSLADLFDGRSQLMVYHFMFGVGWEEGCKSCSYVSDHFDGMRPHLRARDVNLAVISHAPWTEIAPFHQRMGWKFPWVSSADNSFNQDFGVTFTAEQIASGKVPYNYGFRPFPMEEAPGLSVFAKDAAGDVHHTYSSYGRGLESVMSTYGALDLVPKGRDEDPDMPMNWVRYHDRYESAGGQA